MSGTTHAYHTDEDFNRIDQGILTALEGERWLTCKQICNKMKQNKIHETGQCVRRRCEKLEEDKKVKRLDFNSGKNGRQYWCLA